MKRDLDLIRLLLLTLEASPDAIRGTPPVPGYTADEVGYHLRLLVDAGYVTSSEPVSRGLDFCFFQLTWSGHDFLDSARPLERWQQAKVILQRVGSVSLAILQDILVSLTKRQLHLD